MIETGLFNTARRAEDFGFSGVGAIHWNLTEEALYEAAVARGEARIVAGGPLVAETGAHTGRSPRTSSSCATPTPRPRSGGTTTAP